MAQTWEDFWRKVVSFSRTRRQTAGLGHRVLPGRGGLMMWGEMCPGLPLLTLLWEPQIECGPLPPQTDQETEAQEKVETL